MTHITTIRYVKGEPAQFFAARQAAGEFARTYWPDPRLLDRYWLVDGDPLACGFILCGGPETYLAICQPLERTYAIKREDPRTDGAEPPKQRSTDAEFRHLPEGGGIQC